MLLFSLPSLNSRASDLAALGLHVIPYPQEVETGGEAFAVQKKIAIVIDKNASAEDRFTAQQLVRSLKEEFGIDATISTRAQKARSP